MMWLENTLIREFVLSSRIAKICAELLSVKIRLYHDNALVKESGAVEPLGTMMIIIFH